MGRLLTGVVSNCWAAQLRDGSLEEQCRTAVERGYTYVELRQRALGDAEEAVAGDDRPWPKSERLAALRTDLPELRFNLAVEAPFMTSPLAAKDPYLRRCGEAAAALGPVAEGEMPVLRLVDLSPAAELISAAAIDRLAGGIADVCYALGEQGIRLALENSRQPVRPLRELIAAVAGRVGGCSPAPQICWDPANQIAQNFEREDPAATAAAFAAGELFEFHFKQSVGGRVLGDVRPGDLNWAAIVGAVRDGGFSGPALYEIPGGDDIWERLAQSDAYLRPLLAGLI